MRKKGVARYQLEDDQVIGINVTPLVDVCLVLVIIFMVATPMLTQPAFDVKLPVAQTKEGKEEDKVTISLSADGRMAIDAQEFKTPEELKRALGLAIARTESALVIIRADKEATHGKLTELMGRAKEAGARTLTIATEQTKK